MRKMVTLALVLVGMVFPGIMESHGQQAQAPQANLSPEGCVYLESQVRWSCPTPGNKLAHSQVQSGGDSSGDAGSGASGDGGSGSSGCK